jgi:hypothetical protein
VDKNSRKQEQKNTFARDLISFELAYRKNIHKDKLKPAYAGFVLVAPTLKGAGYIFNS